MYVDYTMSTTSKFIEYLYILLYFSSTHLFLNLHSQSVELNSIWYDIRFFDDSMNIYYALIWDLSVTPC
jgi:hypothetical protein